MEIEECADGKSALASTLSNPPDLLIVDLQMSNMGAMAVTLDLRLEESYRDIPHVPVLMLLDRRPDVFLARRSGAEGFLVKPLDPSRLRRAVRDLMAGLRFEDDSYLPTPLAVATSQEDPASALPH
jgi:DNA-binding NarL/FixJ family response regulator